MKFPCKILHCEALSEDRYVVLNSYNMEYEIDYFLLLKLALVMNSIELYVCLTDILITQKLKTEKKHKSKY
jgi:hypothetical protein